MLDFSKAALGRQGRADPGRHLRPPDRERRGFDLRLRAHLPGHHRRGGRRPAQGQEARRQPDARQRRRAAARRPDPPGLQITAQLLDALEASDDERKAAGADLVRLGRLLAGRTVRVTTGIVLDNRDGTRARSS
jgi:hypothetical protein